MSRSSVTKFREEIASREAARCCKLCGDPIEPEQKLTKALCLKHLIRRLLRHNHIFPTKSHYKTRFSRVLRERKTKRLQMVAYLRSRFLGIAHGEIIPPDNMREYLFYIDKLWSDVGLHHSYPLRGIRLVEFVQCLVHIDRLAAKGWPRRGWVGDKHNIPAVKRKLEGTND